MKIAVFELEDWEREVFQELATDHEVSLRSEPLTAVNAPQFADAEVISTFIYSDLDDEVLEQFDRLELVATRSTGYDHIDTDFCREHGVAVCNVPSYGENTVAEHVFGLLLAISHNLVEAVDRTRRGDFSLRGLQGFDLQGKILGVIGTGSIGQNVIQIAKGFEMEVLGFDVAPKEALAERLGFRYVEMAELLALSDVITLHVPANKHTHHLLSDKEFDQMKEGVVIINTSRGAVLDIKALVRGLAQGTVSAAGLDVLPDEPTIREEAELLHSLFREQHDLATLLADHILLRMRNVVITPHSAFNTQEAVRRILDTTVENIRAYERGECDSVV